MMHGMFWSNIPAELKALRQWCYTYPQDPDPKLRKAPRKVGNYLASNINPNDWTTFEQACQLAAQVNGHIGFIVTENDPFTCIDIDVCNETSQAIKGEPINPSLWTTAEELDRYWKICQAFDSYTEKSAGAQGLHIWVNGVIGQGCRRDGVEVYSQERFMICTGDLVMVRPIMPRQQLLEQLVLEIRRAQSDAIPRSALVELEEEIGDMELLERASNAENGEKFNQLCAMIANNDLTGELGSWFSMGYKSQSEADLALMSIFTFYSKSNEQCRRLFRMSGLGKRAKAMKDNRYIDNTLRLIRARQAEQEIVDISAMARAAELAEQYEIERLSRQQPMLHVTGTHEPTPSPAPAAAAMVALAPAPAVLPHAPAQPSGLPWPPGMAGQIAQYVYGSSMRPVPEISIAAAMAFLAGVFGKAFGIPQSGLNLYITLIARSGTGKEAMHTGIANLIGAAAERQPAAMTMVDFTSYVSGPALSKAVAKNNSFINVCGEWGRRLQRMAKDTANDAAMHSLRTVMTDLYSKSGTESIVGGLGYSNSDENISSVNGVAYSFIGETTPTTFYESLSQSMMEDGTLSRFWLIEYDGPRPALNRHIQQKPSQALGDALGEMCNHALNLMTRNTRCNVDRTEAAAHMITDFDEECDRRINEAGDNESVRQMWNRASLKVMRISSILAVADNWVKPIVDVHHVEWALMAIRRDIGTMRRRMEEGDVGSNDDHNLQMKLKAVIGAYLRGDLPTSHPQLVGKMIVTRRFLQGKLNNVASFRKHRAGPTIAMDIALKNLIDTGYLTEVDKVEMTKTHGLTGRAYRVIDAI